MNTNLTAVVFATIALMVGAVLHAADDEPKDSAAKKAAVADQPAAGSLVAVTYNLRYENLSDGLDAWALRREEVAAFLAAQQVDVFGFQEAVASQVEFLAKKLTDFEHHGVGRDDGKAKGEFAPLFYRRERFELLGKGTFWLSEKPDEVGSKGWDAALPRTATWLRLRDKQSGKTIVAANTHFDHRGEKARRNSAALIRTQLAKVADGAPTFLLGDFNATPNSEPHKAMLEASKEGLTFVDAKAIAKKTAGPNTTWNGFKKGADGQQIDHVFVDKQWTVAEFRILDDKRKNGRFLSDHFPIVVRLVL